MRRSDLLIPLCGGHVEAMGGELSLVAQFPDRDSVWHQGVLISQCLNASAVKGMQIYCSHGFENRHTGFCHSVSIIREDRDSMVNGCRGETEVGLEERVAGLPALSTPSPRA